MSRPSTAPRALPWRIALVVLAVAASLAACGSGTTDATDTSAPPAASPAATARIDPTPPPAPTAPSTSGPTSPSPDARPTDVPARVVVAELGIDLAVVPGDLVVSGNPPDYPLCDVAQYLTTYRYPGRPGTTTWVYAHAREGMFLPLLTASEQDNGAALVGREVTVDSTDSRRYTYAVTEVIRHATDRSAARNVDLGGGRLILQTSEGPRGTVPKLQVVAALVGVTATPTGDVPPVGSPRVCAEP